MHLIRKMFVAACAVFAILLWPIANAGNPFEIYEFDEEVSFYVPCLDEYVNQHDWGSGRWREFVTPSNTYHYLENIQWDGEWIGADSERVWTLHGRAQIGVVVDPIEGVHVTVNMVAKPVIGDGPKVKMYTVFKIAVDANGELRAEIGTPWNDFRCFGPNS